MFYCKEIQFLVAFMHLHEQNSDCFPRGVLYIKNKP